MWVGFFMIAPLLSIHFVDELGWAAASIGLVLALRQFVQQTLTVVSGALADRFGAKQLILLGLVVRTIGFAGMAHVSAQPGLLLTSLLAGIGGALFDSPTGAAMAALTIDDERLQFYSVRGVITSLGMTIGPLIGAALLKAEHSSPLQRPISRNAHTTAGGVPWQSGFRFFSSSSSLVALARPTPAAAAIWVSS
jgi:MFS transporter, DHA1 family, multidrug resistance protein